MLFLFAVFVPEPKRKEYHALSSGFFKELSFGFHYVLNRPSLFNLQMLFFFGNLFSSVGFTLLNPMILASSDDDPAVLGAVNAAGAVGGLLGAVMLTAWGGPKKKIHGVILGWLLVGGLGTGLMGLGRSLSVWLPTNLILMLFNPLLNGSNQAIWQAKVAPEVQGRVFSVRRLIAKITAPIAMAAAGPLADNVFEPAVSSKVHWLGNLMGPIFGNEPGSGMSLLIFISGIFVILVAVGAYQN